MLCTDWFYCVVATFCICCQLQFIWALTLWLNTLSEWMKMGNASMHKSHRLPVVLHLLPPPPLPTPMINVVSCLLHSNRGAAWSCLTIHMIYKAFLFQISLFFFWKKPERAQLKCSGDSNPIGLHQNFKGQGKKIVFSLQSLKESH